jgi:F0F1-type ATP synthase assembly protein I
MLAPQVSPSAQSSFSPAGAGGVLVTGVALGLGAGAVVGWAVGSLGYGLLVGAVVGIPIGVFAVYRRYKDHF